MLDCLVKTNSLLLWLQLLGDSKSVAGKGQNSPALPYRYDYRPVYGYSIEFGIIVKSWGRGEFIPVLGAASWQCNMLNVCLQIKVSGLICCGFAI